MADAGGNNQNIKGFQLIGYIFQNNGISVFQRHNNFQFTVPVGGIGLIFLIDIKCKLVAFNMRYYFLRTMQLPLHNTISFPQ